MKERYVIARISLPCSSRFELVVPESCRSTVMSLRYSFTADFSDDFVKYAENMEDEVTYWDSFDTLFAVSFFGDI